MKSSLLTVLNNINVKVNQLNPITLPFPQQSPQIITRIRNKVGHPNRTQNIHPTMLQQIKPKRNLFTHKRNQSHKIKPRLTEPYRQMQMPVQPPFRKKLAIRL